MLHDLDIRGKICKNCDRPLVILWYDKKRYEFLCPKCDQDLIKKHKKNGAKLYDHMRARESIVYPLDTVGLRIKLHS